MDSSEVPSPGETKDGPESPTQKRTGGKGLLLGLLAAGALLLAGVVTLCIWFFRSDGYDAPLLAYMPADATMLLYDDLERIFADAPRYRKTVEAELRNDSRFSPLAAGGISVDDISRTLMGVNDEGYRIKVFRLKKPIDQDKATQEGTELKAANSRYWRLRPAGAVNVYVAFPEDSLVIVSTSDEIMRSALSREAGRVIVSDTCRRLIAKVSSASHWHVRAEKREKAGFAARINPPSIDQKTEKAMQNCLGKATKMNLFGNTVTVTNYTLCDNSSDAATLVEFYAKMPREPKVTGPGKKMNEAQREAVRKMLQRWDITRSGDYVESSATLDITPWGDDLESAFQHL